MVPNRLIYITEQTGEKGKAAGKPAAFYCKKAVISLRIFLESFATSALESNLILFSAKNRSRTGPTAGY